jgi:hypothetical protein
MLLIMLVCSFLNRMSNNDGERRLNTVKACMLLLMLGNFTLFIASFNREEAFFDMAKPSSKAQLPARRLLAGSSNDSFEEDDPSFSSCLMIRQHDSAKLVEWIAYHYFTMPLTYLVVLQDPTSQLQSKEVLQRWEPYMNIVEWTDANVVDKDAQTPFSRGENEGEQQFQLRREAAFYHSCAMHMQQKKRTMVSFHQVNEYVAINEDFVSNAKIIIQQPGSVERLIRDLQSHDLKSAPLTCVTTYSTQFSAIESNMEDDKQKVPVFLEAIHFDTLKWRYHQPNQIDQIGKSFLDVSNLPDLQASSASQQGDIRGRYEFSTTCAPSRYRPSAYIRIHQYPHGSDNGPVTTIKASKRDVVNDELRPWIQAFVDLLGTEAAQSLLQDVGSSGVTSDTSENEVAASRRK